MVTVTRTRHFKGQQMVELSDLSRVLVRSTLRRGPLAWKVTGTGSFNRRPQPRLWFLVVTPVGHEEVLQEGDELSVDPEYMFPACPLCQTYPAWDDGSFVCTCERFQYISGRWEFIVSQKPLDMMTLFGEGFKDAWSLMCEHSDGTTTRFHPADLSKAVERETFVREALAAARQKLRQAEESHLGVVTQWDPRQAMGVVDIQGLIFSFPSTCFQATPTRFPLVGDAVRVNFTSDNKVGLVVLIP